MKYITEYRDGELAQRLGTPSYMVDSAADLQREWFAGRCRAGLTAGASAPDVLVQEVIARLREFGALSIRRMDGVVENVHFPLPRGLGGRGEAHSPGAAAAAPSPSS